MNRFYVYIHGSNDVVRPVELNIPAVWEVEEQTSAGTDRTYAMAREIARQIEAKFPDSHASTPAGVENITAIVVCVSKLMFTHFNGIAVAVPGIVEAPGKGDGQPSAKVQKTIDQLTKRFQSEQNKLQALNAQLDAQLRAMHSQVIALSTTNQQLQQERQSLDSTRKQLQQEQQRRQEAEEQLYQAHVYIQRIERQLAEIRAECDEITRQNGILEVELSLSQQKSEQDSLHIANLELSEQQMLTWQEQYQQIVEERDLLQQQVDQLNRDLTSIRQRQTASSSVAPRSQNAPPGRPIR